jgi:uncharacterized OsmC-like protein
MSTGKTAQASSRVTVHVDAQGIHAVNGAGARIRLAVLPSPDGFNPLELQSAALGICTAITVRNELLRLPVVERDVQFALEVIGTKAADAPPRLARMDVAVSLAPGLRSAIDEHLLERAEAACTIANTLQSAPQIGIGLARDEPGV